MERYVVFSGCQIPKDLFDILKTDLNLPPYLFIEKDSTIINTPFIFDSKAEAIEIVKGIFKEMTILLLFDVSKSTMYLHKGKNKSIIHSLYLPTFLKLYNIMYKENIVLIDNIEDLRIPEEVFKLYEEMINLHEYIN